MPGFTPLTRTPTAPISSAVVLTNQSTPALAAVFGALCPGGPLPAHQGAAPISSAVVLTSMSTPALAALYGPMCRWVTCPANEETATIAPPPAAAIAPPACLRVKNTPVSETAITRCHSSALVATIGDTVPS